MKKNEVLQLHIDRLSNEGNGIGIYNNIVVFCKYALLDEDVNIKIDNIYKNYIEASLVTIEKESKDRIKPVCPYFYQCGGCNLLHLKYYKQLEFKKEKVKSIFKKICNENVIINDIIYDKNLYYRNKITLKVKNNKIGFYKNHSNELIDIDCCFIASKKINDIISRLKIFINKNKNNDINEIMIRLINNRIMISLDNLNNNIIDKFINSFNDLESIYINNKRILNNKYLIENINGLNFRISPNSFFQINDNIYKKMYQKVIDNIDKSDICLDLYSGTGTISILVSNKCKNVVGIEVVKDAVKDANNNLILNNITNVKYICDKVENQIENIKTLNIDTIILDPPRSGCDKKSLKNILEINSKKIIYISCNPITLARDYNYLKNNYIINEITLFDMFPNTYHVETVMVLERK